MARNSLLCADVPLRNYSLTHSLTHSLNPLELCAWVNYMAKSASKICAGLSLINTYLNTY